MEKQVAVYGGKVFGVEVSKHGLDNGYLDYKTLSNILGGCIINNDIRSIRPESWELVNSDLGEYDQIFQDYIISEYGAQILSEFTDEIVFYSDELDMYVWSITHLGTSWDYVLTDIKLTFAR